MEISLNFNCKLPSVGSRHVVHDVAVYMWNFGHSNAIFTVFHKYMYLEIQMLKLKMFDHSRTTYSKIVVLCKAGTEEEQSMEKEMQERVVRDQEKGP